MDAGSRASPPLVPLDDTVTHVEVLALAMVMLTCTVAAIHSICSKADSNRSQEKNQMPKKD